jgi:membrane-associated protease RseP (regulator of RpoE activity)
MHDDFSEKVDRLTPLLADLFEIEAVYRQDKNLIFSLSPRGDRHLSLKLTRDRLKDAGYKFTVHDEGSSLTISIDPRPTFRIPRTNIILFVLTLISVYFVPVFFKNLSAALMTMTSPPGGSPASSNQIQLTLEAFRPAFNKTLADLAHGAGLEFTLALISILLVHEMGHFIASRRRNIVTSWPYFIPAPNIIGTFGAVIKSRSPFWNRRDLIEVGAAGPIAGWIVAVCWLLYGLSHSYFQPAGAFGYDDFGFSLDGESLLLRFCALTIIGPAPAGYFYKFTEAAFAGWVGLVITAINMLPIGQLDGGHIVYGLLRRRQQLLGRAAMIILLFLGFYSTIWWIFAAFGFFFGVTHPPTLDDSRRPGKAATVMGITALIILILSFTPVPFQ